MECRHLGFAHAGGLQPKCCPVHKRFTEWTLVPSSKDQATQRRGLTLLPFTVPTRCVPPPRPSSALSSSTSSPPSLPFSLLSSLPPPPPHLLPPQLVAFFPPPCQRVAFPRSRWHTKPLECGMDTCAAAWETTMLLAAEAIAFVAWALQEIGK